MTGKFPLGPKRSTYLLTEISEHFGIMESNPLCNILSKEPFLEKKKGMEKLAKVLLQGVAIKDDN